MASLFDKIYGCIAASRIGSSMGTLTEGWSVARIKEVYGTVEALGSRQVARPGAGAPPRPGLVREVLLALSVRRPNPARLRMASSARS